MKIKEGRFVVTGGAGFIGSHLVDALLARGAARVAVVDIFFLGKDENLAPARSLHSKRLHVYRDDASNLHTMQAVIDAEKPDVVFNLATKALIYSFFNPAGAFDVNVNLALTCLELLRKGAYGKLIHCSTSEVYGTAQTVSMAETHPLLAETTYAAGKASADLAVSSYVKMFGVDATIVRPFNNYGLRQNDETYGAVIPLTVRRILTGDVPVIEGTGEQTRDFIYVLDTVDAMLRLAASNTQKGEAFNVGSGRETTIKALIEAICHIMDYKGEIARAPQRGADVLRHCANVAKAEQLVGPLAQTPLEKGLEATVEWYVSRMRGAKS
jgi:UDP-glucose 4-epimerase